MRKLENCILNSQSSNMISSSLLSSVSRYLESVRMSPCSFWMVLFTVWMFHNAWGRVASLSWVSISPEPVFLFVNVSWRKRLIKARRDRPAKSLEKGLVNTQKSLCFFRLPVYSLKLKLRPELSVMGEEGPALDTALEGMLPSSKENTRQSTLQSKRTDVSKQPKTCF